MIDMSKAEKGDKFKARDGSIYFFRGESHLREGDYFLGKDKKYGVDNIVYNNGKRFSEADKEPRDLDIVEKL